MRSYLVRGLFGRAVPRSLVTVAAAALLAGCSGSIDRFNNKQAYDNPSDADPVYTASVPKPKKLKRPVYSEPDYSAASDEEQIIESPVRRAAVPQTNSYNYADAYTKPSYKKPRYVAPVEESYDDASYEQPAPAPIRRKKIYAEESYDTGSMEAVNGRVTVGPGMTLYSIARTNGVTVQDVADANNLVEPYMLMTGQTLRIPGSDETIAATPRKKKLRQPVEESMDVASDEEPIAKPKKSKRGLTHTVEEGETLYSLGRKYGVSPFVIADANGMTAREGLAIGQRIRIPGATQQVAAAEPVEEEIAAPKKIKSKKAPLSLPDEEETAQADPDEEQAIGETETATAKKTVDEEEPEQQEASAPAAVNGLTLRWPVKGKVISTFGNKPNGLKNEGINIAVPEGTEVRAAGAGVVAYAGNELKGYGNLVLIRHQGGYVTAYAHAKSLKVKRGDQVKRGDVIALAGQTGAVNSPQLHFEVRKGATALDPLKFIISATASN
jgi:murein DD-endopeptidase MepM/ murein hydrolase activator NlpD